MGNVLNPMTPLWGPIRGIEIPDPHMHYGVSNSVADHNFYFTAATKTGLYQGYDIGNFIDITLDLSLDTDPENSGVLGGSLDVPLGQSADL